MVKSKREDNCAGSGALPTLRKGGHLGPKHASSPPDSGTLYPTTIRKSTYHDLYGLILCACHSWGERRFITMSHRRCPQKFVRRELNSWRKQMPDPWSWHETQVFHLRLWLHLFDRQFTSFIFLYDQTKKTRISRESSTGQKQNRSSTIRN